MLNAIRQFFEQNIKSEKVEIEATAEHRLQLATAALLIEMMRMDYEIKDEERNQVVAALREKFGLGHAETASLVKLAEAEARQATDYHQFTSLINKSFTPAQKERIIEYMWQVAYADGELDKYERHLVHKIADLLYVPHKSLIAAKHRARTAAGGVQS